MRITSDYVFTPSPIFRYYPKYATFDAGDLVLQECADCGEIAISILLKPYWLLQGAVALCLLFRVQQVPGTVVDLAMRSRSGLTAGWSAWFIGLALHGMHIPRKDTFFASA